MKVRIANPTKKTRRKKRHANWGQVRSHKRRVNPQSSIRPKRRRARVRTRSKKRRATKETTIMKRRRRKSRKKSPSVPHRRRRRARARRSNPLFTKKRRRSSRRRRRNPSLPGIVPTILGVGAGAGAGAGVAYGLDKMGVGTPMQRNIGMVILGAASAFALGMVSRGAGVGVGAGIAAVGLTRVLASSTAALPQSTLRGLGTGEGLDDALEGPFESIGRVVPGEIEGIYAGASDEGLGYVVNDYS
jgi:hypothetical protein